MLLEEMLVKKKLNQNIAMLSPHKLKRDLTKKDQISKALEPNPKISMPPLEMEILENLGKE